MSASKNGVSQASFQYDPLGRRVVKSVPTKATTYTYDGADILRENVTAGGLTTTSYYVHGPGVDEPLAKETGGVMRYYHADGLGSIVKETSATGAVTNTLRYDAWGNIEAGARDGFAFTGREWDPETGLMYYRARYYDPKAGRFISEDPIGFEGEDVNLYAYVWNAPTLWSDPSGLKVRFKGTAAQVAEMKRVYEAIKKTARGGQLCASAERSKRDIVIEYSSKSADFGSLGLDTIRFDPAYTPLIQSDKGTVAASAERVLAHELGHAVTGAEDPPNAGAGTQPGKNVKQNENPVAAALGQPKRIKY